MSSLRYLTGYGTGGVSSRNDLLTTVVSFESVDGIDARCNARVRNLGPPATNGECETLLGTVGCGDVRSTEGGSDTVMRKWSVNRPRVEHVRGMKK